jgi:hypothetical protein
MKPFSETYAQWLNEISPVISQRDILTDLGTLGFLIVLLYLFETLSHRFVTVGGIGHRLLRYLLAPGVLIHELGHYLLALISGFRNIRLTLLPDNLSPNVLGHVEFRYRPSLISYIGLILTAIAPLPFGILALLGLAHLNNINTDILLTAPSVWNFDAFIQFMEMLVDGLLMLPWWQSAVFLYLYIVITLSMMPSYQDIKALLMPLVFVSALIGILAFGLTMTSYSITPFLHYGLMLLMKGLQICVSASFVGLVLVAGIHALLLLGRLVPIKQFRTV